MSAAVDLPSVLAEIDALLEQAYESGTLREYGRLARDFDEVIAELVDADLLEAHAALDTRFTTWLVWAAQDPALSPASVDSMRAALGYRFRLANPTSDNPLLSAAVCQAVKGYQNDHAATAPETIPLSLAEAAVLVSRPVVPRPAVLAAIGRCLRGSGWRGHDVAVWTGNPVVVPARDGVWAMGVERSTLLRCANHDLDWQACPACALAEALDLPYVRGPGNDVDLAFAARALAWPGTLDWLRLRTALLLQVHRGYWSRALPRFLVEDVARGTDRWEIDTTRARRRTMRRREEVIAYPDVRLCPVRALDQWSLARDLLNTWHPTAPLLGRFQIRQTGVPSEPLSFQRSLRRAVATHLPDQLGVLTGRSARIGFARDLEEQGATDTDLLVNLDLRRPEHLAKYKTGIAHATATLSLLEEAS